MTQGAVGQADVQKRRCHRKVLRWAAAPLLVWCCIGLRVAAQAPLPDSPAVEREVEQKLRKLSLEQKITLLGGSDGMYTNAMPGIHLPRIHMSDGPVGVHPFGASTAFTAGVALAASWDVDLAERVGVGLGEDARARGIDVVLGPGVNIYRAPMAGRSFEYFGEDPYLSARLTTAYITGMQSQGVVATVKHFALNNQEYSRHDVSSDADERTMREIYLPAFEAAVKDAHTGAVMDSYNLVNGVHASQNGTINNDVLKKEWKFDGILMSDWASTYDGVAAANGGLDLEMPNPDFMNLKNLLPAVQDGRVPESVIDDKVRRILRTAIRFHMLDRKPDPLQFPMYSPQRQATALDEARESIVLLKNTGNLLPLDRTSVHTVAVIGPNAWPAVTGGGGSSYTLPFHGVSILEGIAAVPGVKVLYAPGLPTMQNIFEQTELEKSFTPPAPAETGDRGGAPGMRAVKLETFPARDFTGTAAVTYADNISNWKPQVWTADASIRTSLRYTATFLPKQDGRHLLMVAGTASDAYILRVDGKEVLRQASRESQAPQSTELELTKDKAVHIQLDYLPAAQDQRLSFGIRAVADLISPEAREMAAKADAAVVAVGFNPDLESEGFDRSYALPFGQEALIEAVRKANPKTIVTVTSGGEVATEQWIGRIPALLMNWYPGQEGGTAVAEVLFGQRSPEGKLPFSFARRWEDSPVHESYYAPPVAKGETPHVRYAEGVFLGYRYYTTKKIATLFPFGFGLTYSTFRFSGLSISPELATAGDAVNVSFDVENTGKMAAADVAQLYVGDPSAQIMRPVKELKGFRKVRLSPGEKKRVTMTLDRRSFAYWDNGVHDWRVDPGLFTIAVGDSAEHTPLNGGVTLK